MYVIVFYCFYHVVIDVFCVIVLHYCICVAKMLMLVPVVGVWECLCV